MRVDPTGQVTNGRFHYAWVIALVTFAVLIITAGVRATPGVLMVPLQRNSVGRRPPSPPRSQSTSRCLA